MAVFTRTPSGAACVIRVTPRAGRTALAGVRDGQLFVKLAAAPRQGAANEALIAALAGWLQVPKSALRIAAGAKSRTKRVLVDGWPPDVLAARLAPWLTGTDG